MFYIVIELIIDTIAKLFDDFLVFLVIMGLINKQMIPNNDRKVSKFSFDLFWF
jgi:hypothetical protein